MRILLPWAVSLLCLATTPSFVQAADPPPADDYIAGASQPGTAQQRSAPPVIGLRREADYLAMQLSFLSDSRDFSVRQQEIHAMLLAALDKARAAGFELATGNPVLAPVTRENYRSIAFQWAGREDTSKAEVLIKVPLAGNAADAEKRIDTFLSGLERKGRGMIQKSGARLLVVRSPEQYRATIVGRIAESARTHAEAFGPDYRALVDGIDKPVQWSQVSDTEVFLYLPYSFRIAAH